MRKIEEIIGCDLRSLAAFRVSVALVILADLFIRSGDLVAHYSDSGVIPREALYANWSVEPLHFSIFLAAGHPFSVTILFVIYALAAIMLLAGYRTKVATLVCFLLQVSIANRNPFICQGGDNLLRLLLFWALFLPLGARFSVDSALRPREHTLPSRIATVGTLAYVIQMCVVYVLAGLLKSGEDWVNGDAVYYVFNLDMLTRPLGQSMLQYPYIMKFLTHFTVIYERFGPLLFVAPFLTGYLRLIAIAIFWSMQMGFNCMLYVGEFPWVSSVALVGLLPSLFWDRIIGRWFRSRGSIRMYYNRDVGYPRKLMSVARVFLCLDAPPPIAAQGHPIQTILHKGNHLWGVVDSNKKPRWGFDAVMELIRVSPLTGGWVYRLAVLPFLSRWLRAIYQGAASRKRFLSTVFSHIHLREVRFEPSRLSNALATFALTYVIWWNGWWLAPERMRPPDFLSSSGLFMQIDQSWNMFAPTVTREDGWYVFAAKLRDGTSVDLNTGRELTWEKPGRVEYKNQRWRCIFMDLYYKPPIAGYMSRYFANRWNASHPPEKRILEVEVFFMLETTPPPGQPLSVEPHSIWKYIS